MGVIASLGCIGRERSREVNSICLCESGVYGVGAVCCCSDRGCIESNGGIQAGIRKKLNNRLSYIPGPPTWIGYLEFRCRPVGTNKRRIRETLKCRSLRELPVSGQ